MGNSCSKAVSVSCAQAADAITKKDGFHYVLKTPYKKAACGTQETAYFATGCFWGAEAVMWKTKGVVTTSVGYMGGHHPSPTYDVICGGNSGHAEAVKVVYNPAVVSYCDLLKIFWSSHDPTQGNRQGNDVGTQYRSAIFTTTDDQRALAQGSKVAYEKLLLFHNKHKITTEIKPAPIYHYAEPYHQQYLAKPGSRQYCSAQPTGIRVPPESEWGVSKELITRNQSLLGSLPKSQCAGGACNL